MLEIDFSLADAEVLLMLQRLEDASGDLTPAMGEIAAVLEDVTEQAFEDEADPASGEAWPELADSTIAQRTQEGKWPGKMLQKSSGGLAPSISTDFDHNSAVIGSNKVYAAIHQFGGDTGLNHGVEIPARPYLGLSPEGKAEVIDIINDHLQLAIK